MKGITKPDIFLRPIRWVAVEFAAFDNWFLPQNGRFGFTIGAKKSPQKGDRPWIEAVSQTSYAAAALNTGEYIYSVNDSPVSGMKASQVF